MKEKLRCPQCQKEFDKRRPWQRFCRIKCRNDYHNLHNPKHKVAEYEKT